MAEVTAQRRARGRQKQAEALMRAFTARDLPAIHALADAGCDLDAPSAGLTVLMRMVLRGDPEAVEWILAAGADPGVRSSDGKTALDFARDMDRADLVELLQLGGAVAREDTAVTVLPALPAPRTFSDAIEDRFEDHFDDTWDR